MSPIRFKINFITNNFILYGFFSDDIIPRNIALATENLPHVNIMPTYGLNVYSMLKHDTLVLTESAADKIQTRLLYQLNRNDGNSLMKKFRVDQ